MHTAKIQSLYDHLRGLRWLNSFVILTRFLVGFAFIPSGLKKLLGERFTQLGVEEPIGFFFEALYRTGMYWNFIGLAQLLAALLLMTQRFATLGAVFFFFIMTNIWMITLSLQFSGTWVITSLMLLAVLLLLAWDYHKLQQLFFPDNFSPAIQATNYPTYNRTWIVTGAIVFTWSVGGLLLLKHSPYDTRTGSRLWLGGIILIVLTGLYFNRKHKPSTLP